MKVERAYNILDNLIQQGFDTVCFDFRNLSIVFKTLSSKELKLIRYHTTKGDRFSKLVYELAYSTFMFKGRNMLIDRVSNIETLVLFYGNLPTLVLDKMESCLRDINENASDALTFIEGYCYTDLSRSYWVSSKSSSILSEEVTGIVGTGSLGMNISQTTWVSINRSMDLEDKQNTDFSNSMFVASASNPDGVKKARQSANNQRELVDSERNELVKYGSKENRKRILSLLRTNNKNIWTADISTADSMVEQLNKEMEGFKDKHDLFIEKHEKKQLDDYRARKAEERERTLELRRKIESQEVFQGHRPVTQEEMEAHLRGEIDLKKFKPTKSDADVHTAGKRVLRSRRA
jgi:hypothetical protein